MMKKVVIHLLSSMTGYGKQVIEQDRYRIAVEMRSVNNRFLDITLKMPRSFFPLEEKLKKTIKKYVNRGKVEVYVTVSGEGTIQRKLQVDWDLVEQYIAEINEVKNRYPVKGDITIHNLLEMEDIFTIHDTEQKDDTLEELLVQAVENASRELYDMRQREGTFLKEDLSKRLNTLTEITSSLESIRPHVIESYGKRIRMRIDEHLATYATIGDDSRIIQEVAILAEKGDITEELTRLNSHIIQMREIVNEPGRIGRKLDFICQEMHREANTIGSKATATEVNELDILLKTEIEKIKEQVQNIE